MLLTLLVADAALGGDISAPLRHLGLPEGAGARLALLVALYLTARLASGFRRLGAPSLEAVGFVLLGAFAVWSRFRTLAWDITHGAEGYELLFLNPVFEIIRTGDLNHRYHLYPGLFIYMLLAAAIVAFMLAVSLRLGTSFENVPLETYLAASRGLVAGFSALNVALAYVLGRNFGAGRLSLLVAAFVCFAPAEVDNSQFVRPDIVLEAFLTASLILMARVVDRGTIGAAILAGVAVGAATAVKYTGFLAIPSLLVACALAQGPFERRLSRMVAAFTGLLVTFVAASPYSALDLPGFVYGLAEQGSLATGIRADANLARLNTFVIGSRMLGYVALGLAAVGVGVTLRAPRAKDWILLSYLAIYLGFLERSPLQGDRLLLPCLPVLSLFAARGLAAAWSLLGATSRWRSPAVAASVLVVLLAPALETWRYVSARTKPSPRDRARSYIEERLQPGSRVAVSRLGPSLEDSGMISGRFVVFDAATFPAVRHYDYAVSSSVDSEPDLDPLRPLIEFQPEPSGPGRPQKIWQVPEALRPQYRQVPPRALRASSATAPDRLDSLFDGDATTIWRSSTSEDRSAELVVEFAESTPLGRLVLHVPPEGRRFIPEITYSAADDAPFALVNAHVQSEGDRAVVYLPDIKARRLRLELAWNAGKRIAIAELEVESRVEAD